MLVQLLDPRYSDGHTQATITTSMREVDRLKTIQAVVDRMLPFGPAAQRLGVSRRQIDRLVSWYQDDGPSGLVSRKRGRPSNNQLALGIAERAVKLIRERYADFGPTLLAESSRNVLVSCSAKNRSYVDGGDRPVDATQAARPQC